VNDQIRAREVRLVGPEGEQVGIVPIGEALRLAQDTDLDLVEVAPTARPPVCKLMDYGKFKYESAQKAREARRNQSLTVIKEMKLRPKIDPHDYATKKGHVVRFLKAGDKVKVTIMFRGREQSRPELGFRLLKRLAEDVQELGFVESSPKQDGRNMIMVMAPHRVVKPTTQKPAAEAGRESVEAYRHRVEHPPGPQQRGAGPIRPAPPGEGHMPKNKTHKGTAKRVKLSGSGKLLRQKANRRHLLEHKPSTRTRRLDGTTEFAPAETKRIKRLLGL